MLTANTIASTCVGAAVIIHKELLSNDCSIYDTSTERPTHRSTPMTTELSSTGFSPVQVGPCHAIVIRLSWG
jgi:hypothetical protein